MRTNDCSRSELVELVAKVVEKILTETDLSSTIADRAPKPPECPPHTLCCSKNHICEGHGGFACSPPYSCQNGFEERLAYE
jgi:hypothetical protein